LIRNTLAAALSGLLALTPAFSQQGTPAQPLVAQAKPAGTLKVTAVEGEGAKNNIRTRTGTQIVVEVRDEADKPVAGADVVFQLPAAGPGGVFNGWMRSQTGKTNAQGQAGTNGLTPNDEDGRFNVKVTATLGDKTGSLVVAQSNVRGNGSSAASTKASNKKLWTIIAIAAGAAVGGGVAAASGGDKGTTSSTATVPVTISAGTVTVGGPR